MEQMALEFDRDNLVTAQKIVDTIDHLLELKGWFFHIEAKYLTKRDKRIYLKKLETLDKLIGYWEELLRRNNIDLIDR